MIFRGTLRHAALLALLVLLTQGCWSKPAVVSFPSSIPKPADQTPALESATEPATDWAAASAESAATSFETPAATPPQATESMRRLEAMLPESRVAAPDKDIAAAETKYDTRVFSRTVGAPL